MEHTPVTQEYLIDLYRSLIIKRDDLKNNAEQICIKNTMAS